jgi:4a-hydroxytetrahydrobiopterin dehydratase
MALLTQQEIDAFLRANPKWKLKDGELIREWTFNDFNLAMAFVNRVAAIAEAANHHPDIDIRYNHVRLALTSHDAGGVTSRDLRTAESLNQEVG